jgi:F420-dependent oxidoreductase-like protein
MPNYTYADSSPAKLFDQVVAQAQAAENNGFSLVTVMDHLYQIGGVGPEDNAMLEGYSVLSALARETSKVRLGTLVTGVTYRNPAFLVKTVTTLDIISGGRALLGLGAAWNEDEHLAFGYDFPRVKERMDRLDDALAIAKGMFSAERFTYEGRYSSVNNIIESPPPIQPGGPKIMVGGAGEQRTLRIAAKYADMTHWFSMGIEGVNHKSDVLRGYCHEIGRDFDSIERTMGAPVAVVASDSEREAFMERVPPERRASITAGSPAVCAEALKPYIDAGFSGFTFGNTTYRTLNSIALVGETLALIGA